MVATWLLMKVPSRAFLLLFLVGVLSACPSVDEDSDLGDAGVVDAGFRIRSTTRMPSMATCPPGSTLTYESFAQAFFENYCTRCHAVASSDRRGAPLGYDFDTLDGVRARLPAIDLVAAAGPRNVNIVMPLGTPAPTDAERDMLGEWIACGGP